MWAVLAGMTLVAVVVVVGLVVLGDNGLDVTPNPQVRTPAPPGEVIASAPRPAPRRAAAPFAPHATAPAHVAVPVAVGARPAPVAAPRVAPHRHHRPAASTPAPRPSPVPRPPTPPPAPAPVAAPPVAVPVAAVPAPPPVTVAPAPAPRPAAAPAPAASPALTLTLRRANVPGLSQGPPGSRRLVLDLALSGPSLPQPAEMTLRLRVADLPPGLGSLTSSVDVVGSPEAPDSLQLRVRTQVGAPGDAAPGGGASNAVQVSAPLAGDDAAPAAAPGPAELLLPLAGSDGHGSGETAPAALPVRTPATGEMPTVTARLDTDEGGD